MPLTDLINPYAMYIKITLYLLVAAVLAGSILYVRHVFNERDELRQNLQAKSTELSVEKQKYVNLMAQAEQMIELNQKIIQAVQRVKVNSSVYIDRVEASKLAVPVSGGTVLVPGGVSKAMSADRQSIFKNNSSNRTTTDPA